MLGRVADAIFWMSRYIERADNVARFIAVNHHMTLDLPGNPEQQWEPLIIASGDEELFEELGGKHTRESVIHFLTFDKRNPNSILSCLRAARDNARSIREVISTDMWRVLNRNYLDVKAASQDFPYHAPHAFFESVRQSSSLFMGVTYTTMTHGEGWRFSQLGRLLERADKTTRILDVKYFILLPKVTDVGTPYDGLQWMSLLRSTSAAEMYRQRHGRIVPETVVEFLLLDREFPRAVVHCLTSADECIHSITGTPLGQYSNQSERLLGALRSNLAYTPVKDIISCGLHEFIDDMQVKLNDIGSAIHEDYFALRTLPGAVQMPDPESVQSQEHSMDTVENLESAAAD